MFNKQMKQKKLLGYINVEDLKQLERIKQDLFELDVVATQEMP